ncbi:MAG TPA: hypothetical protein VGL82_04460 [Bryobacteraceae bacterium]
MIQIANLKMTKTFVLDRSLRAQADIEVFNVFNGSAPTSTSYLTGPTYDRVTGVVSPRVARIGMRFTF